MSTKKCGDYPLDTEIDIGYSGFMIGFKISIVDLAILLAVIGLIVFVVRKLRK